MKLADYQRAVLRQSLAVHADDELPGFALYRQMIRARFQDMAQVAFKQTWALLGATRCLASFARYLADTQPTSPLLRTVIFDFAAHALADHVLLADAPDAARDLLRFEANKWSVASAEALVPAHWQVREVDFDGVLVRNPTLVCLRLAHDVSSTPLSSLSECRSDPHTLLLYRRDGEDDVHWYRAPEVLADVLALCDEREQSLGERVQALFLRPQATDAQALLEQLAAALTVAVERGVLWGVRDPVQEPPSSLA